MIPDWETERRTMVERQLRRRGIRDARVLQAMGEIPREEFVPPDLRVMAYGDAPVQIGWGQTISQPYMTALMAQELELTGAEVVLEVGAGSGYAAAVGNPRGQNVPAFLGFGSGANRIFQRAQPCCSICPASVGNLTFTFTRQAVRDAVIPPLPLMNAFHEASPVTPMRKKK